MSSCLARGFFCFLQCFLGAGKYRKLSCCGYRVVRKGRMERNRLRPVYTCDFCCSNLMQISSPSGAISKGFYRDLTPQGYRTCYNLSEILLQFFNDEYKGPLGTLRWMEYKVLRLRCSETAAESYCVSVRCNQIAVYLAVKSPWNRTRLTLERD